MHHAKNAILWGMLLLCKPNHPFFEINTVGKVGLGETSGLSPCLSVQGSHLVCLSAQGSHLVCLSAQGSEQ